MKKILGRLRRAVDDFNMIQDGDKIAVGLSGGKDSTLLLQAMKDYQRFSPQKFELCAITINMGLDGYDPSPLVDLCNRLDIEYRIVDTYIGKLLFEVRKEKNPCSLCANMRRGALHNAAKEMGVNKLALAHHMNDVIETMLLSLFYEGRISTFSPVTYLSHKDIYIIRPFIYIEEVDIKGEVKKLNLPIVKNPCPANGFTKRQYIKDMIKQMRCDIPDLEQHILGAIMNTDQVNIWDKSIISKICNNKNSDMKD